MKKIFLIISMIMFVAMAQAQTSVWDGSRKIWTNGKGTKSEPYLIESAENLAFLAYAVNKGYCMNGVYFRLTTDLDLNGSNGCRWEPIGTYNKCNMDECEWLWSAFNDSEEYNERNCCFQGHFDGGKHNISNIYIVEDERLNKVGLFGSIKGGYNDTAVVENVFVTSGYIKGVVTIGGIVGYSYGNGLIRNCVNGATIEATSANGKAGGIVGEGMIVKNCYNYGEIKGWMAGGILGYGGYEISECYNEGGVVGTFSGGIVGMRMNGGKIDISNCYNTGKIVANNEYGSVPSLAPAGPAAGGIVGFNYANKKNLTNCYNVGEISSIKDIGCLVGWQRQINLGNDTIENNYYLNTCSDTLNNGIPLSDSYMRTEDFLIVLNADGVWSMDEYNDNNGFPVLFKKNFDVVMEDENIEGCSVSLSTDTAPVGEEVLINITVESGYAIKSIKAFKSSDTTHLVNVYLKNGDKSSSTYAFIMPSFMVKVSLNIQKSNLGVEENDISTITITPNPTNGKFSVEVEGLKRVCVFNIMGQKMLERTAEGNRLECDISRFGTGIYILQVETTKGIATQRVVSRK